MQWPHNKDHALVRKARGEVGADPAPLCLSNETGAAVPRYRSWRDIRNWWSRKALR